MIFALLILLVPALLWAANRLLPATAASLLLALARRWSGLEQRTINLDDFRMAYSAGGSGETLLLLHGLGADRSSFAAVAALLRRDHHLIIPDLPGFGATGAVEDDDYGITVQCERLHRFVEKLGLDSFHLGGNSMGGWIAAAYAARYPAKVKSLWLLAAAGTEELLETEAVKLYQSSGRFLLLAQNEAEFDAVIKRIFVRPPALPYCLRWVAIRRAIAYFPLHAKIFVQLLERGEEFRLEPVLPGIAIPTLLMWGDQDQIVPLSVMRSFARLMQRSESVVMAGIGHVPQMEAPKQAVADYRRFRAALLQGEG